jgi:hypothetical protein
MEVKEAVQIAINYIDDLFSNENISNVGLEEITFDDTQNCWNVTVGFSRPWDYQSPGFATSLQPQKPVRQYKIIKVSDLEGKVKTIKIRE